MLIRAKAPLRVSFAGGGTDVPPFPAEVGGLVLNATINRYAWGSLRTREDRNVSIHSVDFGLSEEFGAGDDFRLDGKLGLAKAAVRRFASDAGFDLLLHSNAPPGSGLGASSAMMVALIGALKELQRLPMTDYELAELAHGIERDELGIGGGRQDQYAATFGGFNFIEFDAERTVVNPLRISEDVLLELEHNLLLVYTGTTRQSDHIIDDQTARFERRDEDTVRGLSEQKELAVLMKNALMQGRLEEFGHLLGTAWEAKKRLSDRITNPRIDELHAEAMAAGAVGGKVTGAGGGGFLLLYCGEHARHAVAERLAKLDAPVDDFAFEPAGLRTWRVRGS
jgi:D-glycero-alpha-D-manno-heptose-7-phosphate kinase